MGNDELFEALVEMIQEYPNDMDLGKRIREMVNVALENEAS